jgi:hypothetical protein
VNPYCERFDMSRPELVDHQRNRLHRLRRLVGRQGDQWLTVDRCAHEKRDLDAELHRPRRQRGPVHDGFSRRRHFPSDGQLDR